MRIASDRGTPMDSIIWNWYVWPVDLACSLPFGRLAHGGAFRGRGGRWFVFFLTETFKVLSKHFHFTDDLVGSGLCSQVRDAYNG